MRLIYNLMLRINGGERMGQYINRFVWAFIVFCLSGLCSFFCLSVYDTAHNNEIPIVLAFNNQYALGAGVTIASIIEHADKDDKLVFYILEKNVSSFYKEKIEQLKKFRPFEIHWITVHHLIPSHLNYPTYYRYLLGELFPQYKKVIYMDVDVYVFSSLKSFYNQNIDGYYIAGVEDMHGAQHTTSCHTRTFNAGVMLVNIDMWRKNHIFEKATDKEYQKYDRFQKDQTVLNCLFNNSVLWLSPMYNFHHSCQVKRPVFCAYGYNRYSMEEIQNAQKNMLIFHYIIEGKPWNIGPNYMKTNDFFKTLERYLNGYWVDNHTILLKQDNQEVYQFPGKLKGKIVYQKNGLEKIIFEDGTIQYLKQQNNQGVIEYKRVSKSVVQ